MAHWASAGFGVPGGLDVADYAAISAQSSTEGLVFRVISMPSVVPCPQGASFTQYSTCLLDKLETYTAHGWRDERFESAREKECIDWINRRPDCSLDAVLRHDPALAHRVATAPQGAPWAAPAHVRRNDDSERGKSR
mmetsp:Transcript_15187/g.51031  ORF Transcript_15187/g.51031 Transcript_15187/m.51031 type:complete len:137 (-) Transcript_15187:1028-1438(-)